MSSSSTAACLFQMIAKGSFQDKPQQFRKPARIEGEICIESLCIWVYMVA